MPERVDTFGRPLYPWETAPSTPAPVPPRVKTKRQAPPPADEVPVVIEAPARKD